MGYRRTNKCVLLGNVEKSAQLLDWKTRDLYSECFVKVDTFL